MFSDGNSIIFWLKRGFYAQFKSQIISGCGTASDGAVLSMCSARFMAGVPVCTDQMERRS